ncbi:MAG: glutathione synthase [Pseudomonadales bacterium]|nr:glutathione synthase [Pseudomonadales bacterium]
MKSTQPLVLDQEDRQDINDLDALVIRKDPPFDKSYLHLTYLLEFLSDNVLQINPPAALRDVNEKLYTLNWPDHCPDTLVSCDRQTLMEFAGRHKKIVLKPLDDCSGRGIRFIEGSGVDEGEIIGDMLQAEGYVMAQAFLTGVRQGDKRVYLVAGKPVAWVNRVPAQGSDLANIHQGAICEPAELTDVERHISEVVGQDLVSRDIMLAGLDFIDGRLTEINVTSPSALRQINQVTRGHAERAVVDAILERIAQEECSRASVVA